MNNVVIVLFQKDLRLTDNPALYYAEQSGATIVPLYVHAPADEGAWKLGGASRWWLHHSLSALSESIVEKGSSLFIAQGRLVSEVVALAKECEASAVYCNARFEPQSISEQEKLAKELEKINVELHSYNSTLLTEPGSLLSAAGEPYTVYTPFYNSLKKRQIRKPFPTVKEIQKLHSIPRSLTVDDLGLLPEVHWDAGLYEAWEPGEAAAQKQFRKFLRSEIDDYSTGRNRPDRDQVSRMSPHLHFGEISVQQMWHQVLHHIARSGQPEESPEIYLKELVWREFAYHLLVHFPETVEHPLRAQFSEFPWESDDALLRSWQVGKTGYPIVDAGMRQLWHTGWMHNRVRMIVASFLVKHLLQPWQDGAMWFWDTLVDADLASNTLGWQWTAGCGADAAPYFRIFNPTLQGEKFDPQGDYVRKWVPELESLPAKWIHRPWDAPAAVLECSGIDLGSTYPRPIVEHTLARQRALSAFESIKKGAVPAGSRV